MKKPAVGGFFTTLINNNLKLKAWVQPTCTVWYIDYMVNRRSWTKSELRRAVRTSRSLRQTIKKIGLVPAGGNYAQVKKYIKEYDLDTSHFKGKGWSKGLSGVGGYTKTLDEIMVKDSSYQSYKLKKRLFKAGIKEPQCEKCGWAERSEDGRLPLELDHMNGDSRDNRLKNLRVLCPNCHSLQPTHRGRNQSRRKS